MKDLENSLRFSVEEMCDKMEMILPGCSLNYPASSLCRMLDVRESDLDEAIANFCADFTKHYGALTASPYDNGWCFTFSAEAVRELMQHPIGGAFLKDVCHISATHHTPVEKWKEIFSRYGEAKLVSMKNQEYDWILYYPSGNPVSFVYCLKQDGTHITSHRLEKVDFDDLFGNSVLK